MKKRYEFRPSTLDERKKFYEKEFSLKRAKKWFKDNKIRVPQMCAIDAGGDTGIIIDKRLKGSMLYFSLSELEYKIKKYVPEDVYYDRNYYENYKKTLKNLNFRKWKEQELVFDIDADNIPCAHSKKNQVCKKCLTRAYFYTMKIKKILKGKLNFKKLRIVYSGRGFHIHIFDKKSFSLSLKERKKIVDRLEKFPIDPWVTRGYMYLIRMPFSLNGLVSRKVIPLNSKKISNDFYKKSIPEFLRS